MLALDVGAQGELWGQAGTVVEFVGTVLGDAQVRTKLNRAGESVPVLCLDLGQVGPGHHTLHAEQSYTEAERERVQALALAFKKGARVRVRSGLSQMHLCLSQVRQIALVAAPSLPR
jgi:hypothetical protein